ncbi:MAG: bifunctional response regulator/alkaline phosphatase family protein [Bacteroidia bacterium]|nr:bifunctional response regulator/alkaline phosphatase family protein [Bacteroidia bacterium]
MKNISILWTDDEIDLLKPHIMFLEAKGFHVATASNGDDAVDQVKKNNFDIIFLDENMPGLSGLQTLAKIKDISPEVPVVMITKSEEEDIMEEAIGSKISDYLIKPVNPNQILLSIKKNIDTKRLITKKTTSDYQAEFAKLAMLINEARTYTDWIAVYRKLVYWELELEASNDNTMDEVLRMQKAEANNAFAKFVKKNYLNWFDKNVLDKPLLSPGLFKSKIFPILDKQQKVFMILIDNLRYDQWKTIQLLVSEYYNIDDDGIYFSILPTATQYARNAIFSGLMPSEIGRLHPDFWIDEEDEEGKNIHEEELLGKQLNRSGKNFKIHFEKIFDNKAGEKLVENLGNILDNLLNVVVFNFVDMLSHARTESKMIRELANDESAYRSLSLSWFKHSPLLNLIKELSLKNIKIILTTDHGAIRVGNPIKVIGDKNISTNLRYKQGKSLNYNPKEVFEVTQPQRAYLPSANMSTSYIFATNDDFFAYPNNYNHYVKYYKDTFQHGGISLEEMLIPLITLSPKS